MKGLEKGFPMIKFSKTVTETITIKYPKTLQLTTNMVYVSEKHWKLDKITLNFVKIN